ncbi:MAG: S8 family serine peptidase [Fidelibacterota bacterium]|nr:MAG: S8 family serine peptidase [Candidatus Neomarinimicrobiota bacterium]
MNEKFGSLLETRTRLIHSTLVFIFTGISILPVSVEGMGNHNRSTGTVSNPQFIVSSGNANMVDGVVIVKFIAPQAIPRGMSRTGLSSLDRILDAQSAYDVEQAFPLRNRALGPKGSELRKVYYVRYGSGESPRSVALKIARDPNVEFAIPWYLHRVTGLEARQADRTIQGTAATPNDPLYPNMTHLAQIQLPAAWDSVKAQDGDVVIAIVDGGTDWRHEDLQANIWTNPGEIADNGIDDDGNGFVDDVHGWNFADDSNDPTGLSTTPVNAWHGTAVAGVASAVTDNGIGIAGSSWNAQLMPVNISCVSDTFLCYGDEGIIYAALNGADIINASWGSAYADITPFEEQLLLFYYQLLADFLAENGALLISSAGNGGENNDVVLNLPAGAPGVLAVSAIRKADDIKSGFSNYGVSVDVFTPGEFINTTAPDNQYSSDAHGTSFSAPLAVGTAALVKARFPHLSPYQLAQQVRVTADPIDDLNPNFTGLMGKGRVNAYRAVTDTAIPAIRILGTLYLDSDEDGYIESGETVYVRVVLANYLADATNVEVALSQDDPNVKITSGYNTIPSLLSGAIAYADFQFKVDQVDMDYFLRFILDISAGSYQDRDLVRLYANEPIVLTHDTGPLRVSLTEEGNIGWIGFAYESPGQGFVYNGTNLLFEGGLLVGTSSSSVSDCIRGVDDKLEKDFEALPGSELMIAPGQAANEEGSVVLTDQLASLPLGLIIRQDSYADNSSNNNDFVIFSYIITNSSESALSNLYAGLFFDWDINQGAADFARFDQARQMGIVQDDYTSPTFLAATRLLTSTGGLSYRAIDNAGEIYGGDAGNGFTAAEKWAFLSSGIQTRDLDTMDVSTLTASGPYTMQPGQSIEIAFAVIAAGSQAALETNADNARTFWDNAISPSLTSHSPVFLTTLPDTTIVSINTLTFTYVAEDADGDNLTFSLVDPPLNATIGSETGVLTFQPDIDQTGTFIITVTVSDDTYSSTTSDTVTVEPTFYLYQNYSNPFHLSSATGETTIPYQLRRPVQVRLTIYDILGREVKTLMNDEPQEAGKHTAVWNGRDNRGRRVSTGLYLYRIQAGGFTATRKLVLLK